MREYLKSILDEAETKPRGMALVVKASIKEQLVDYIKYQLSKVNSEFVGSSEALDQKILKISGRPVLVDDSIKTDYEFRWSHEWSPSRGHKDHLLRESAGAPGPELVNECKWSPEPVRKGLEPKEEPSAKTKSNLNAIIESLREALELKDIEIEDYQRKMLWLSTSHTNDKLQYEKQNRNLSIDISNMSDAMSGYRAKLNEVEKDLSMMRNLHSSELQHNSALRVENGKLLQKVNELAGLNTECINESVDYNLRLKSQENTINELTEELKALKNSMPKPQPNTMLMTHDALRTLVDSKNKEIESLMSEIKMRENQEASLKNEIKISKEEISELKQKLNNANAIIEAFKSSKDKLENEVRNLKTEINLKPQHIQNTQATSETFSLNESLGMVVIPDSELPEGLDMIFIKYIERIGFIRCRGQFGIYWKHSLHSLLRLWFMEKETEWALRERFHLMIGKRSQVIEATEVICYFDDNFIENLRTIFNLITRDRIEEYEEVSMIKQEEVCHKKVKNILGDGKWSERLLGDIPHGFMNKDGIKSINGKEIEFEDNNAYADKDDYNIGKEWERFKKSQKSEVHMTMLDALMEPDSVVCSLATKMTKQSQKLNRKKSEIKRIKKNFKSLDKAFNELTDEFYELKDKHKSVSQKLITKEQELTQVREILEQSNNQHKSES